MFEAIERAVNFFEKEHSPEYHQGKARAELVAARELVAASGGYWNYVNRLNVEQSANGEYDRWIKAIAACDKRR